MVETAAAEPLRAAAELERLGVLARLSGRVIESELHGTSMGATIPSGSLIRIDSGAGAVCGAGRVVAIVTGSRVMVHRIVHEGRSAAARGFVITQGDGNWLCDPPVERSQILGPVDSYAVEGVWRPVGPPVLSGHRRFTAWSSRLLMSAALERRPAGALRLAQYMTRLRMSGRRLASTMRRYRPDHVRD